MAEGIIFGGYLLSEEQFIPVFTTWYQERKLEFRNALQAQIIDVIKRMVEVSESEKVVSKHGAAVRIKGQYDAKAIYMAWENLTREYFGNGRISIIAGAKFGNKNYQWTKILDESQVIDSKGISIRRKGLNTLEEQMKDVDTIYAAAEVQDIINKHFDNLVRALDTYTLTKEDAIDLHQLLAYRKSKLNRPGFTGSTYNEILFGSQQNAAGKQLDAYMNHIGNYHKSLFAAMTIGMADAQSLNNLANDDIDDDFSDMFANNRSEIQTWLLDSLNTASWLTGGDIVVVGDTGQVIYNIQLKTTNRGKTFEVATSSLLNFAVKMRNLIDNEETQPEELARVMYNELKTTSANEISNTEKFFKDGAYNYVEENLKLPKGSLQIVFNS